MERERSSQLQWSRRSLPIQRTYRSPGRQSLRYDRIWRPVQRGDPSTACHLLEHTAGSSPLFTAFRAQPTDRSRRPLWSLIRRGTCTAQPWWEAPAVVEPSSSWPLPEENRTFSLIYSLTGRITNNYYPGVFNPLAMDAQGNLYGVAFIDGTHGFGSVFKLTSSNGSWTYTSLHDFTSGADGANPIGGVTFDASGNLYGTTVFGGSQSGDNCRSLGCGVVWKITP